MEPTEFARIVRIGLGRANLVLRREALGPYRDVVVAACLHDQAYDPQLEGIRRDYLLDLIRLSGDPAHCRRRVLDALPTTSPEDYYDLRQLFALARAFAQEGDVAAREAMYASFAAKAADPSPRLDDLIVGGDDIVHLDGVDGFLFVAEHLGARILADASLWADDYWLSLAEKQSGEETVRREVERARRENPAIDAYLTSMESTRHARGQGDNRRVDWVTLSYDELKPFIGQPGRKIPITALSRWGQGADERSLLRAADDLLHEDDPRRLLDYVRIFGDRAFPLDPQPLIRLAWSDDEKLSWAAGLALGNVRHPLVRQAALDFLTKPAKIDQAVGVLAPNYEPGDHVLVEQALASPQDTDEEIDAYHHVGYDVLDLVKANPRPELAASLLILYERGPCSYCRERCFDRLRALDRLPAWLVEECCHDANPDLREKAKSLSASQAVNNSASDTVNF